MSEALPRRFGDYVFLKALGKGAMGDVHLARPARGVEGLPRLLVVKRLRPELVDRKGFTARFEHEASVAVAVKNPHVAKVYESGQIGPTYYIAMEFVRGWPLSKVLDAILRSGRHASIASVIDLVIGGLEGLEALHSARHPKTGEPLGAVHRDISPKNLMVGEDGAMRLIDLGLGKSKLQGWKTRTGVVMGSVGYLPPEQARGEHVDARADVYAIGVVAFEMLVLRNYIKRGPVPDMMSACLEPKFTPPSRYRPDVPAGLDGVLQRALAPEADARFPSAESFLRALQRVVPVGDTEGTMSMLLDDLFGATRQERRQELRDLLALPEPEGAPGPDGGETRVFAKRPPSREVADTGPPQEQTRATQVAAWAQVRPVEIEGADHDVYTDAFADPSVIEPTTPMRPLASQSAPFTPVAATGYAPRVTPVGPGGSYSGGPPPTGDVYYPPPPARVSLPVLVVAVALASAAGVAIGALFLGRGPPPPTVSVTSPTPLPDTPTPRPTPGARTVVTPVARTEAPSETPEPAKASPASKAPRRSRRAARRTKRREVEGPSPRPVPRTPLVDSLRVRIAKLRRSNTDDATRERLNRLARDLTLWAQSENSARKTEALNELEQSVRALESGSP